MLVHNFQILDVFVLQNKEPIFLLKWIRRLKWSRLLIILEVPICFLTFQENHVAKKIKKK